MKFDLFKCDWCNAESKVEKGHSLLQPWPERVGTTIIMDRDPKANTKEFKPVSQTLNFCSNKCNQTHKEMESEAQGAADKAWVEVYNRRKA